MAGTSTTTPPVTDAGLARWLAAQAGDLLLRLRAELGHDDAGALRAGGDRRSHEFIAGELARWRPADAVLSEEGRDDPARLQAERVWIVDPLDGTREYGEDGRTDWAVHVALWQRNSVPSPRGVEASAGGLGAGAVALPAQYRVLGTDAPPAYPPMTGSGLRLAASRSRPPAFLAGLAAAVGAELVPMGSAGAKIAAVIGGDADAYVHAGGQYEWDSTPRASTGRRWSTTGPTRCCPIWWSAGRILHRGCWPRSLSSTEAQPPRGRPP